MLKPEAGMGTYWETALDKLWEQRTGRKEQFGRHCKPASHSGIEVVRI